MYREITIYNSEYVSVLELRASFEFERTQVHDYENNISLKKLYRVFLCAIQKQRHNMGIYTAYLSPIMFFMRFVSIVLPSDVIFHKNVFTSWQPPRVKYTKYL